MVRLINLTSLPCFHTFFQLYHGQSSTLHRISFFLKKMFCYFCPLLSTKSFLLINPRRACAARVTVLGLCVCVCVCVCLSAPFRPLRVKVSPENDTNASSRQDKENKTGDFLKNAPFKSYGIICSLCRRSAVL